MRYIIIFLLVISLFILFKNTVVLNEHLCPKPIFNKDLWNSSNFLDFNNCYSYALNEPDSSLTSKRQPGELRNSTIDRENYVCGQFDDLIKQDNPEIYSVSKEDSCECNEYKIALALDNNETPSINDNDDYHFYRQDNNTDIWSHKVGYSEVSRVDANGSFIYDPETADRQYKSNDTGDYDYDEFCGFYCVPYNKQKYAAALEEI